jgi:hypothetical protein
MRHPFHEVDGPPASVCATLFASERLALTRKSLLAIDVPIGWDRAGAPAWLHVLSII